jgi:plasmid stabilization system protein ParE
MAYTVSLSGSAEADAYAAFEHIREVAPASAARWLTGLFATIQTLADMPARRPIIPKLTSLAARCAICCTAGGQARIVLSSTSRKIPRKGRVSAC